MKPRTSADSNLYLADLTSGAAPKLLTEHTGNISYDVYDFSADGASLIYSTDEAGEFTQAWTYALATGARKALVTAGWDVMLVKDSPSGRFRVSAINVDGSTAMTIARRDGSSVALSGVPAGDLGEARFDRTETTVAFSVSSDTSPSDIFVASLADGKARRLTTALNPVIKESDLVEASVARFKSYDGLEIPGILYQPNGASAASKVPAVVLVHGGPGGQSRRGYSAMIQHLVNNGYGVYAINNRGSSGYGKTFYHLDDKRHGDVDLKDVVASRKFLASLGWVDPARIGIMGGSYGGYMVAAALAFAPDAFDVGIDIFGVTNWSRTLASTPAWWPRSAKRSSTRWATPRQTPSVIAPSRRCFTPGTSASRCSCPGCQRPARPEGGERRTCRCRQGQQGAGGVPRVPGRGARLPQAPESHRRLRRVPAVPGHAPEEGRLRAVAVGRVVLAAAKARLVAGDVPRMVVTLPLLELRERRRLASPGRCGALLVATGRHADPTRSSHDTWLRVGHRRHTTRPVGATHL